MRLKSVEALVVGAGHPAPAVAGAAKWNALVVAAVVENSDGRRYIIILRTAPHIDGRWQNRIRSILVRFGVYFEGWFFERAG